MNNDVKCIDQIEGERFVAYNGDSVEIIAALPDDSVGLSVFSPPFPGMYAYTNSARDVGNVKNFSELVAHFSFLASSLLRVTQPGRICCVHLTQEPVFSASTASTPGSSGV